MADPQQLEIIKKGVKTWNKWREENPSVGEDFSEPFFKVVDLSEANLFRANLIGAKLIGADLSGADLSEAALAFVNFNSANLSGADLTGAFLSFTVFVNST